MTLVQLFYRKNPRRPFWARASRPSRLSRFSRLSRVSHQAQHSVLPSTSSGPRAWSRGSTQHFFFEPLEPRVLLSATPAEVVTAAEPLLPQADPPVALVVEGGERPAGSLIYTAASEANFGTASEKDRYTIDVDSEQKLTTLLFPAGNASLQGKIELFNPSGGSLGTADAPSPGLGAVIPNIPITTAGVYTIEATSLAGTGDYFAVAFVNADVERELVDGTSNNTRATAQDLVPSSIALQGSADRLAVFGEKTDDANDDYYKFNLAPNQVAFMMVTPQRGGNLGLRLFDEAGTELARGIASAENVGQTIPAFRASTAGTYYVRITGAANSEPGLNLGFYNLVVTRGSAFDLEPNAPSSNAQPIGLTQQVLGSVGLQRSSWEDATLGVIRVAVLDTGNAAPLIAQLNDDTFYNFTATAVTATQISSATLLANYGVVVIGDPASRAALQSGGASALKAWFESGGAVVGTGGLIQAAGSQSGPSILDIDTLMPIRTSVAPGTFTNPTITQLPNPDPNNTPPPIMQGLPPTFALGAAVEYSTFGPDGFDGFESRQNLARADGKSAVAWGSNNAQGRSVWLGPTYFDAGSTALRSGTADRLLEQAVAWAGRSGVDTADQYVVPVNVNDPLVITITTPGSSAPPHQPVNTLVPSIQLFKSLSDTTPVATGGGGVPLVHTATTSGPYYIIVTPQSGFGDYTLQVTRPTGDPSVPLTAQSLTPVDGASLTTFPSTMTLQFSSPILLPSLLDPDVELTINGQPATLETIVDGQTVRFTLPDFGGTPGLYTAQIAQGDVTDIRGNANSLFTSTFTFVVPDTTGPTVTDVRVLDSSGVEKPLTPTSIFSPGPLTITVTFSEALDETVLEPDDLRLTRIDDPTNLHRPTGFNYDPVTHELTADFQYLHGGRQFRLTLVSGSSAVRDLAGNPLNGAPSFPLPSGQTHPDPDDFVADFWVGSSSLLPLEAIHPPGSLIYEPREEVVGQFETVNDPDTLPIDLDAGQTLLVGLFVDSGIRGRLEIFGPDNSLLGSEEALSAGQEVLVPLLRADTAGTYQFKVTNLEGTGFYRLGYLLDSDVDNEFLGGTNNTVGTAQDLTASAISLPNGASRLAVNGSLEPSGDVDIYAFQLAAGQFATVVAVPRDPNQPFVKVELTNGADTVLASGIDQVDGTTHIARFRASQADTYYARVSSNVSTGYLLIITRGADFEEPWADRGFGATDLTEVGQALGSLDAVARPGGGVIKVAVLDAGNMMPVITQLNDKNDEYFNFDAVSVGATEIDTLSELDTFDVVLLGDPASGPALQSIASVLRTWATTTGHVVGVGGLIQAAGINSGLTPDARNAIDEIIPVQTSVASTLVSNPTIAVQDILHPVTQGLSDFGSGANLEAASLGSSFGRFVQTVATANGQPAVVVSQPSDQWGGPRSVWLGPRYGDPSSAALRTGSADQLLEQAVAWASGVDVEDSYLFFATAGNQIVIETSTPFDGPREPLNTLDPNLALLKIPVLPNGLLPVKSNEDRAPGDRNARIDYLVPPGETGRYVVTVGGVGTGPYTLSVTRTTPEPGFAPFVKDSNPKAVNLSGPQTLDLIFSEGLRLDMPAAISDLTIDGGATVTGVQFLDGRTVRFSLSVPNTERAYAYTLAAEAVTDLQGQPSDPYQGSFVLDKTGPHVTTSPSMTVNAPFSPLVLEFNEPLDPANVSTADIVSFTGPFGNIPITGVSVAGNLVTIQFSPQNSAGTYSLVLGPNITDLAGNPMDQTYQASVTVTQLPTLTINNMSVSEGNAGTKVLTFTVNLSAASGQQVQVNYATQDGSATSLGPNADYVATSGTVTFDPGVTSQIVSVTINGDAVYENDEQFTIVLSSPVNATIATGTGTGTIVNDDPRPTMTISDVTLSEGNSGMTPFNFTITLSNPSSETVTVEARTSDGDGSATPGSDYQAISSQLLTFDPGQTSKTLTVTVFGDTVFEDDESFLVILGNLNGATFRDPVGDPVGSGIILNDEVGAPGRIRGQKFNDLDEDGLHDPLEPGVDSVTIELVRLATGAVVATQTTQSRDLNQDSVIDPVTEQGLYEFSTVEPGTYLIRELLPAGSVQTYPALPGDPATPHVVTLNPGWELGQWLADAPVVSDSSPNWVHRLAFREETTIVGVTVQVHPLDGRPDFSQFLSGPMQIRWSAPADTDSDGIKDRSETEILLLELTGADTGAGVPSAIRLQLGSTPSGGFIRQTAGSAVATSVLDVFLVDIRENSPVPPIHFMGEIEGMPPYSRAHSYSGPPLPTDPTTELTSLTLIQTPGLDFGNRQGNQSPVITSNGGGDTATVSLPENQTTVTTVVATDLDIPPQLLTYSLSGGVDAARFTIDPSTGVLSFLVVPDFESPTDSNLDNKYEVTARATDPGGLFDEQALTVAVKPVNDNSPVFTSSASPSLPENQMTVVTLTATDADLPAQTVFFAVTGGADQAKFSIIFGNQLRFNTPPDFENPTDADANNIYQVSVTAFDGVGGSTVQNLSVTVTPVNDNAPVITSDGGGTTAAVSVYENQTVVTTVVATDGDRPVQSLTYNLGGFAADNAKFTINPTTGVLSFLVAPDFENPTDANHDNVYEVIVKVTDPGIVSDGQAIAVTVNDVIEAQFQGLGDLPDDSFDSSANDVSGDGTVVVGYGHSLSGVEAFRWTPSGGIAGLGDLPNGDFLSYAQGVSADGTVAVGSGTSASGQEAFRWTQAEGLMGLGDLPGGDPISNANGVSADGTVVVGQSWSASGYEAFRWTLAEGMVGLGDLPGGGFGSYAVDVSADGAVVVGQGWSAAGFEAFRWTQADGMVGLGDLSGGDFNSQATDVSADGSVIVGHSQSASGYEAFRWTQAEGMVGLGKFPGGDFESYATGVSADGTIVVGYGGPASSLEAFIWDAVHGMRNLKDALITDYGLETALTGWTLREARGISADGQTIVGVGTNPSGQTEAWRVTGLVPLPSFAINDVSVTEGNSGTTTATFTITKTGATTLTSTVDISTADGTTNPATTGIDYLPIISQTLTFQPNESSKQVTVTVFGETVFEPDETFFVTLTNATNATIADGQGVGTIQNDDPQPTISIGDVELDEGNSDQTSFNFTVSLSNPSSDTVTVTVSTANGTVNSATASSDYQAIVSQLITFNPGETIKMLPVAVFGDTDFEADETFFVNLSTPTNATLTDNQGLGTILNDDVGLPDLIVTDLQALSNAEMGSQITVSWTVFNQGVGEAALDWVDRVYLSRDPLLDRAVDPFLYTELINSQTPLAAGAQYTIPPRTVTISPNEPGTWYLLLETDASDTQAELDETNNVTFKAITVAAPPQPPSGSDSTVTTNEDTSYSFREADFRFIDPDPGDTLSAVRIDTLMLPTGATLTLGGTAVTASQLILTTEIPTVVFTPAQDANGQNYASFTFSVRDSQNIFDPSPNILTIAVTPVNDPPVALKQAFATSEDVARVVTLMALDVERDPLTFEIVTGPLHGTLSGTGPTRTYTPTSDYFGFDAFTFTANDGQLTSNVATASILVTAVPDAPTLSHISDRTVLEGQLLTFPATAQDVDTPAQDLRFSLGAGAPEGALINETTGAFTWTPTDAQGPGQYDVRVIVSDGSLTDDQLVRITVLSSVTLDIDGDGAANEETDGRLLLRYLAGLPDLQLVAGLTFAETATRTTGPEIRSHLDFVKTRQPLMLDADGDGLLNPFTDGRLLSRFIQGATDAQLLAGSVLGPNATRTTAAAIRTFLEPFQPMVGAASASGATLLAAAAEPAMPAPATVTVPQATTATPALAVAAVQARPAFVVSAEPVSSDERKTTGFLSSASSKLWLRQFVVESRVVQAEDPNRDLVVTVAG